MRYSIYLCVVAALTTGCASDPPTPVATGASTSAPYVEGVPVTQAAANGQPVALDVITTEAQPAHVTQTAQTGHTASAAPAVANGNQVVCEQIATIGTRLTRKVCKTQEQIAFEREQAGKVTEGVQRPGPVEVDRMRDTGANSPIH